MLEPRPYDVLQLVHRPFTFSTLFAFVPLTDVGLLRCGFRWPRRQSYCKCAEKIESLHKESPSRHFVDRKGKKTFGCCHKLSFGDKDASAAHPAREDLTCHITCPETRPNASNESRQATQKNSNFKLCFFCFSHSLLETSSSSR